MSTVLGDCLWLMVCAYSQVGSTYELSHPFYLLCSQAHQGSLDTFDKRDIVR